MSAKQQKSPKPSTKASSLSANQTHNQRRNLTNKISCFQEQQARDMHFKAKQITFRYVTKNDCSNRTKKFTDFKLRLLKSIDLTRQLYSNKLVEQFSKYCEEGQPDLRQKSGRSYFSSIGSIEVQRQVLKQQVVRLRIQSQQWQTKYRQLEEKMVEFIEGQRTVYESKILELAQEIMHLRNNPTI